MPTTYICKCTRWIYSEFTFHRSKRWPSTPYLNHSKGKPFSFWTSVSSTLSAVVLCCNIKIFGTSFLFKFYVLTMLRFMVNKKIASLKMCFIRASCHYLQFTITNYCIILIAIYYNKLLKLMFFTLNFKPKFSTSFHACFVSVKVINFVHQLVNE
jgi:hypothetical protein